MPELPPFVPENGEGLKVSAGDRVVRSHRDETAIGMQLNRAELHPQ